MKLPGMNAKDLKYFKEANYVNLTKAAIDYSDGIVIASQNIHPEIAEYLKEYTKPILPFEEAAHYGESYNKFYDRFLADKQ